MDENKTRKCIKCKGSGTKALRGKIIQCSYCRGVGSYLIMSGRPKKYESLELAKKVNADRAYKRYLKLKKIKEINKAKEKLEK